jgi:hypothetical protein
VQEIRAEPPHPGLGHLVGKRGGGGFRQQIDEALPGDREAGTLLYFLLDDIPPATLISGYIRARSGASAPSPPSPPSPGARVPMENVCSGWRTGGAAAVNFATGVASVGKAVDAPSLALDDDPIAWHRLDDLVPASMRRRRRVDVSGGDAPVVDALFRDTNCTPDGDEIVVHEYSLGASVDAATGTLADLRVVPRVLPFPECEWAVDNVDVLIGCPVGELRSRVIASLAGIECCTHLNDMLRALAEVPVLLTHLD